MGVDFVRVDLVGGHEWGRLPHMCINKRKMRKQIWRPFIVFSFSTTFPRLLVNQSFIPGVGVPWH